MYYHPFLSFHPIRGIPSLAGQEWQTLLGSDTLSTRARRGPEARGGAEEIPHLCGDTCPGMAVTRGTEHGYGRGHQRDNGRKMATG